MTLSAKMLEKVVFPASGAEPISRPDADGILEIACLTVATDGSLAPEEILAVRVLGGAVRARAGAGTRGAKLPEPEINAVLDAISALGGREERTARLRKTASALASDAARRLAYKVSVAAAMSDLNAADAEFELDIDLIDALQLSNDAADDLSAEVHEALLPED